MKKLILCFVIIQFVAGLISPRHSHAQQSTAIKDTASRTNHYSLKPRPRSDQSPHDSLAVLKSDTLILWETFRKQSIEKIKNNENRISELKTIIANGGDGVKLSDQKTINEAERRNDSLRNRLDYYRDEKNENLELFKQKFKDDINAVTKSIRSIKIKSK